MRKLPEKILLGGYKNFTEFKVVTGPEDQNYIDYEKSEIVVSGKAADVTRWASLMAQIVDLANKVTAMSVMTGALEFSPEMLKASMGVNLLSILANSDMLKGVSPQEYQSASQGLAQTYNSQN